MRDVVVLVGSLRKASFSRKVARVLREMAAGTLVLEDVGIGDLPLYNEDLEADVPAPWTRFRERVRRADAALFVSPEYNRSVPGLLKNAIDVGSRPSAQSVWRHKPAAVVSVTTGVLGAFGANHHLRQSFVSLDMLPLQQPEMYIGGVAKLLDDHGQVVVDTTRALFQKFVASFAAWIELTRRT
jgi:chromate reductase, NAD(P)H dehydrogenase (quinone)